MTKYTKVKDSGVREDMDTGSRRDTQKGKPRPDLNNPLVIRRLGMHMANGCDKYGEHNYELGQPTSRYLASLERHLLDYKEGLRDEDHLAAIMWNVHGIIMNQEFVERGIYPPEMDDFCDYTSKEGFDNTVRKRANAFNDSLRAAEDIVSDVTYENLEPDDDDDEEEYNYCDDCKYEGTGPFKSPCSECGTEGHREQHLWEPMDVDALTHDEGDDVCGCNLCDALKNEPKRSKLICTINPSSTATLGTDCQARKIDDDHVGCDVQFICTADFGLCSFAERKFQ